MEEVHNRKERLARLRMLKEQAWKANNQDDEGDAAGQCGDPNSVMQTNQHSVKSQPEPGNHNEDDPHAATAADQDSLQPKLSFRRNDPLADHLRAIGMSTLEDVAGETLETHSKAVEKEAKELEKQVASQDVDLTNLAPRKPGFDLARDLATRMERLEKETAYAIAENIRQRLKASKDVSGIGETFEGGGDGGDEEDDD